MGRLEELKSTADETFNAFSPVTKRQQRAVAGLSRVLSPDGLHRSYAPRHLLQFTSASTPMAAIAIGSEEDLANPSHITWQLNGIRYRADTFATGAARGAARLHLAQKKAGAEHPVAIAWLGYVPPGFFGSVFDRQAKIGARDLLSSWMQIFPYQTATFNIDAHSYGTVVALYALNLLPEPYRFNATVLSGVVGAPPSVDVDQLPTEKLVSLRAEADIQSVLATGVSRWTSRRKSLKVISQESLNEVEGIPLRGHNTHGGQGYRDIGTQGLNLIAQLTV